VVGVPKTIDNDLSATATTFGFDSAVPAWPMRSTAAHDGGKSQARHGAGSHGRYAAGSRCTEVGGRRDVILIPKYLFPTNGWPRMWRSGCRRRRLDPHCRRGRRVFRGGEVLTLDGTTKGEVRLGGIGSRSPTKSRSARSARRARWCWGICSAAERRRRRTAIWAPVSASGGADGSGKEIRLHGELPQLPIGSVTIKEAVGQIKHVPRRTDDAAAKAVGINFGFEFSGFGGPELAPVFFNSTAWCRSRQG